MRQVRLSPLFAALVLVAATSGYAHHSVAPNFDLDREIMLADAMITEFRFVNPHVYLSLEVPTERGSVTWRCEMAAASRLRRRGWTAETLATGQIVSITGSPAWREDSACRIGTITFADGSIYSAYEGRASPAEVSAALVPEEQTESRTAYLPNGQPNLSGPWISTQSSLEMPEVEPTAAGAQAGAGLVRHFDSPTLRCQPMNIVHDWFFQRESNDIYQDDDEITLQYGYLDIVRTIHLDQSEHPPNLTPSITGHSIGWWEGDTLVVDTIGFEPGVLFHSGESGFSMHSDQWHVIERFALNDDGRSLIRTYTFEDPLFMQGVYTGQDHHSLTTEPYVPYGCEELSGENNQRPSDGNDDAANR